MAGEAEPSPTLKRRDFCASRRDPEVFLIRESVIG